MHRHRPSFIRLVIHPSIHIHAINKIRWGKRDERADTCRRLITGTHSGLLQGAQFAALRHMAGSTAAANRSRETAPDAPEIVLPTASTARRPAQCGVASALLAARLVV